MPSQTVDLESRIKTLGMVLAEKHDRQTVDEALRTAGGDITAALANLKGKLSGPALQKVTLAHSLAVLSDDHLPLVKAIVDKPGITNLRDVALRFDVKKLVALVDAKTVPADTAGATSDEKKRNFAFTLQNKLFAAEPTAVLQRMVQDAEVPIADAQHRAGVITFLANQPEFNIRNTSVYTALKHPDALKGVAEEHRAEVVEHLKTLQRVQAISSVPAAVPVLMNANLTSAFRVAELPESTFLSAHGAVLGEEAARQVYTNAINAHVRNEQALMTMRDAMRGAGLAIIDGQEPQEMRMAKFQAVADEKAVPLNLETLFGSMDYCECDACLSVYSPAAYFVDILQYLRNNDLGPDPANPDKPNPGIRKDTRDISNTPLEKLFRRRPDLGCLELTCENTFTVLPYIDLVNELMESFVVHLEKYERDPKVPKQAILEVFNVSDETTSELLAQPQHVNYQAYCILKDAVYPFTLPYHQPIDAARIWLQYLGTSRYDLLNTFRTSQENVSGVALTPAELQELHALHSRVLDRSADAEFLGITQEEHIVLTREAFWPKAYFDLTLQKTHTQADYEKQIGVKPLHEYYGYGAAADLLSTDETLKLGLTFVKKQFLPRTGVDYLTLVDLVKTRFVNPAFPQGRAMSILESIRFSYRFLQTLVDTTSAEPRVRLGRLIEFLNSSQSTIPRVDSLLHPDPCHQHLPEHCLARTDFDGWVHCYFERIGKLIVLEAGEGPQLPIHGQLFTAGSPATLLGTLRGDGTAVDKNGKLIGTVDAGGQLVGTNGKPILESLGLNVLHIKDEQLEIIGFVVAKGLRGPHEEPLPWLPARDTCDLDKVRLVHLDGTALTVDEFDRMQRFIRLWRKLGWTIAETDLALVGTASFPGGAGAPRPKAPELEAGGGVGFDMFQPDCRDVGDGETACADDPANHHDDMDCPELPEATENISVGSLSQLVALRKLLDLTGLPLDKLLTFWATINTAGEKSLYSRLFLTHNLLGIDRVFKSDGNGNYLTEEVKLSDHLPVVMAALKMKSEEVAAIVELRELPDVLNLENASALYRHSLLRKLLHVAAADLPDLFALLGDPFKSPKDALAFLGDWGHMEDAGFTFRQLSYLIRDNDDPLRPLAPSPKSILQISKTLYDGLNAIERDHHDVPTDKREEASTDLVRAKVGLLYEPSLGEQILGLLEGTTVYTTNAPPNQIMAIPDTDSLAKKLKYTLLIGAVPPSASVQVTGALTDAEKARAKALSGDIHWAQAIDRLGKQALQFFNDNLAGIFPDAKEAVGALLAGDINVAPDPTNPFVSDMNTAPIKRYYFLQFFLPFLRQRLAHRLIVANLSSASGITTEVTDVLLSDVLVVGASKEAAITALERIHQKPAAVSSDWAGYLVPPFDDAYTFVARSLAKDDAPPALIINGQSIPFTVQQEDPSNVWSTDPANPTPLKGRRLYALQVKGQPAAGLQWKTSSSPKAFIPEAALLPDYSSSGTSDVFTELYKAALLVNGFNLTAAEASYWQTHGSDFAAEDGTTFDFNAVALGHWRRLQAYTSLRDRLPKTESSLLDLFKWANSPKDPAKLSEKIIATTHWKQSDVRALLAPAHFDLDDPKAFRSETNLLKLQQAIEISETVGTDVDRLFAWANPVSSFSVCHRITDGIRATLRARYDQDDWEQVVKPLNDQLRENQKQALINYLLVQQPLIDWGVTDADGLFEFFLIDVQMGGCMKTSRIKQAISTVQLFVQRCLLGEEDRAQGGIQIGVPANALDRDRWTWMQKYRIWEANRKVFLYPENWLKSELRDDKSQPFKDLESELLQKDITPQTAEEALKNYVFKVDEIANLKVTGLFVDGAGKGLHIFARTRNAPYFFYYRFFDTAASNWYPWEKVQVDIPSYDQEDTDGKTIADGNGAYLIPVVWGRRLLAFFPQFLKKTMPASTTATPPIHFWEIKLGWSERRNGKWTAKQLSAHAIYDSSKDAAINHFRFTPRIMTGADPSVKLEVFYENKLFGSFTFRGSQAFADSPPAVGGTLPVPSLSAFHVYETDQTLHSFQAIDSNPRPFVLADTSHEPYFKIDGTHGNILHAGGSTVNVTHPFAHELLSELATGGLDSLFDYYLTKIPNDNPDSPHKVDAFGGNAKPNIYHELKRPYSLYNWEAAFHAPMLLAERLLDARHFDQALKVYQYALDPHAKGTSSKRFWRFFPFTEIDATDSLEKLFLSLQANTPDAPDGQITEWRNKPFQPHAVARARPSAYMKWVTMKYIEALIAYGDYYFRQNTLETIPLAIQCYVLASHVYGPRAQTIPKRGQFLPQTYNGLLDKWDAFSNAMVEIELVFPFSNQTPLPVGASNGVVGLANVFGFASSLYFCIPDNPQLRALRDTIDDRLFKIRHCQDIDGVFRDLPLFEPPIDPALLVQATAQGLSLSTVLNDLNSPMPNYRFGYLLQKSLELCTELKSLGNSFHAAKKDCDAETLGTLRARHESSIHNLVMEVKKLQVDEAGKALDALRQSRKGPAYRLQHYLKLLGEDLSRVPQENADFGELTEQIENPVDDSGLKLSKFEKEETDKAAEANDKQEDVGRLEAIANILHSLPNFTFPLTVIPSGYSMSLGGSNLGSAMQAVARANQVVVGNRSFSSTNAGRKAGLLRQLQDRVQQANIAGYECSSIDKQSLTQQIPIDIAQREITNQQKAIDNAQEVEEFLRNKYTNEELYSWMSSQISGLYHQAYNLAYDMARRAERLFQFERGLTSSNFIQYGYWDPAHDGLFSGERLYVGLKQLEAAYQEKRGHDFEITKSISLREIDPLALLQIKETGSCEFALPEVLFDMDYAGHYQRRIKSVSLRIPCVLAPHTSLNCTLRLLEHKFRFDPIAKGKGDYAEQAGDDDRFRSINVPITSIAVSSLDDENGVFELNFHDERYLPFEGAGVISKWKLELPEKFRQFDYDTMTDVILRVRYTSLGSDKLKAAAAGAVEDYIKSVEDLSRNEGLFAIFDLKNDFPNEWHNANHPVAGATERVLTIRKLNEKLPSFTRGRAAKNIVAMDVYLFVSDSLSPSVVTGKQGDADLSLRPGKAAGTMKSLVASDLDAPLGDFEFQIKDTKTNIDKMFLVARYVLT